MPGKWHLVAPDSSDELSAFPDRGLDLIRVVVVVGEGGMDLGQ
jgi:hypothetical protein